MLMTAESDPPTPVGGYYTAEQAMQRLRLQKGGFAKLRQERHIDYVVNPRDGRSHLYRADEIDRLAEERAALPPPLSAPPEGYYTHNEAMRALGMAHPWQFVYLMRKHPVEFIRDPRNTLKRYYPKADIDRLAKLPRATKPRS